MTLTYTNYTVHHFKLSEDYLLTYYATDDNEVGIKDSKKYFLPREKNENYKLLTDGRNFDV